MRQLASADLVGIGWRTALAPAILCRLDEIDVVEVILDDYLSCSSRELRPLLTLGTQVPVIYHGVGLGLASSIPIAQPRLDKLARLLDILKPEIWSEHLSFVRAGPFEIGHLAAPPRTQATIEGAVRNLERIFQTIGALPVLENIATLVNPPGSIFSEPEWTRQILDGSDCRLLLDLHNLYANAVNFGFDPFAYLQLFPLERVRLVHLSGGKWIDEPEMDTRARGQRLLDDHIHDVPEIVFELLSVLAKNTTQPLTVIIERDGEYPEFSVLLEQVRRTRRILHAVRKPTINTQSARLSHERPTF